MELSISNQEIASIIEALYDGVLRRISWSIVDHPSGWRTLDIGIVQKVMDSMMSAYVNVVMTYRDNDEIEKMPEFERAFTFSDATMDMISTITVANTWDDIPIHTPHQTNGECDMCDEIFGRQSGRGK